MAGEVAGLRSLAITLPNLLCICIVIRESLTGDLTLCLGTSFDGLPGDALEKGLGCADPEVDDRVFVGPGASLAVIKPELVRDGVVVVALDEVTVVGVSLLPL